MTWLAKAERTPDLIVDNVVERRQDDAFQGIRCPQCAWRPSASAMWCCDCHHGGPEPPFESCGRVWNTFTTRGRCPGCRHQWIWTSCQSCQQWSPHEDWYEHGDSTH